MGTFLGVGHLTPGSGTWAAGVVTLLWGTFARYVATQLRAATVFLLALGVILAGIPAATRFARSVGRKDPSEVVIDEVAGQLLAMVAVPVEWRWLLMSLGAFRFFDIVKPWPVNRLEHLPEGVGIVLDDAAAGLYALLLVHVLLRIVH